jgi:hypothetical protein
MKKAIQRVIDNSRIVVVFVVVVMNGAKRRETTTFYIPLVDIPIAN